MIFGFFILALSVEIDITGQSIAIVRASTGRSQHGPEASPPEIGCREHQVVATVDAIVLVKSRATGLPVPYFPDYQPQLDESTPSRSRPKNGPNRS